MKKNLPLLLLATAFNPLLSQTNLPAVRGIINNHIIQKKYNDVTTTNSTKTKNVNVVSHSYKTTAVSAQRFTGSMNAFGVLVSESNSLNYNAGVNAVTFVHRKSPTYAPTSNGNSGSMVGMFSTNGGATWDSTCIWASGTNFARYPQGGLYNPLGNTNIANAYMVGMGPITDGSNWVGNWYASKSLSGGGNATPGTDQQAIINASSSVKPHHFSRYSFQSIDGGLVRSMATIMNDPDATTNSAYGVRGAAMVKGQFNAGAFVWSLDSFIPPVDKNIPDDYKYLNETALQAWNNSGTIGYVVMLGVRTGGTLAMKSYQPIVYKTTNSGASWALLPANDFTTAQFTALKDRLWSINSNSNTIVPYFSNNEGWDITVDMNGNMHLACTVIGAYSTHADSLDYTYTFGSQQYDFPYVGGLTYPTIYDFYTTNTGGWQYIIVDSMGTEGPSGTSGYPGYTSNVWNDGSGSKLNLAARIQLSRSNDGKQIIYTWTESDSSVVGLKWNVAPDIKMKGYDVNADKVTPRYNVTGGVLNADGQAYFHYTSPIAMGTSSTSLEIPFTITYNNSYDGGIPVDHYYVKGATIASTSFSVNPTVTFSGIKELNNNSITGLQAIPNPATDFTVVKFQSNISESMNIKIQDVAGRVVSDKTYTSVYGENEIKLTTETLSQGLYIINITSSSINQSVKLIKN